MTWDEGSPYETGVDRGVFYPNDGPAEPWNGLSSVKETPSSDTNTRYIDGVKTYIRHKPEDFSGTIEAFSHPESFYEMVLLQNRKKNFGLSYRVKNGDDYKIHLIYNVLVMPSSFDYRQMTETDPFSWVLTTKPVAIPGAKASSHVVIDTSKANPQTVSSFEDILYGNEVEEARLPSPYEIVDIFEANSILLVVDHGDGSFTVTGPDEAIQMIDPTTFQISWPSVIYVDEVRYTISSM